ncbi:MAG: hypothetical protein P1U42_07560 [Phycisphaerales bacterium]|nr:hypothetical protein [Phycisphaerales bacterium]
MSQNIWRAFPELDQFDDDICLRYLQRARQSRAGHRARRMLLGWCLLLLLVYVGSMFALPKALLLVESAGIDDQSSIFTWIFMTLFLGPLFVVLVVGLRISDRLTRSVLLKQLNNVVCIRCEYSLIGLEIHEIESGIKVVCPECGESMLLVDIGISETDINPV